MPNPLKQKAVHKKAFTVIEASISIILLSLLIAAIFFAKKIIKEDNVKSLIIQIRQYDAAINSFTEKYHALPGDVTNTIAYGITEINSDGNGDNIITDRSEKILQANGEITNFWMHLSKTQMLDKNYDGGNDEKAKVGITFPASNISDKIGIVAFGAEGKTFYQIGFSFANSDRLYTDNRSLKSDEAFFFDKKIDDGNPKKGRVIVAGSNFLNVLKNDECVKFSEYNISNPSPTCQLRIEIE